MITNENLFKKVMSELNSTYIDDTDPEVPEKRLYPFEGTYIVGIKNDKIEVLFSIETAEVAFTINVVDLLNDRMNEYDEYIVVLQFFEDNTEGTVQTTRIYRRNDKADPAVQR